MLATARVRLSARERQIALLRVQGKPSKEIAHRLEISVGDVNARILGIVAKAHLAGRDEVKIWVLQRPEVLQRGVEVEVGLHPAGCRCSSPYCLAMRATAGEHPEGCLCDAVHPAPLPRAA